jgi:hypothetical protein
MANLEKGLKLMGLNTDQLVDQFLKDDNGALTFDIWPIFWQTLKQKKKTPEVITKLLNWMILALQGTVKSSMIHLSDF